MSRLFAIGALVLLAACPQEHVPQPPGLRCSASEPVELFDVADFSAAAFPARLTRQGSNLALVYRTNSPDRGIVLVGLTSEGRPTGSSRFVASQGQAMLLPTTAGYELYFYRDDRCVRQPMSVDLQFDGEPIDVPEMEQNCGVRLWGAGEARLQAETTSARRVVLLTSGALTRAIPLENVTDVTAEAPDTFYVTAAANQRFNLWQIQPSLPEPVLVRATPFPDVSGVTRRGQLGSHGYLFALPGGPGGDDGTMLDFVRGDTRVNATHLRAGFRYSGASFYPAPRPMARGGAAVLIHTNPDTDETLVALGVALDDDFSYLVIDRQDTRERELSPAVAAVSDDRYMVTWEQDGAYVSTQVSCEVR